MTTSEPARRSILKGAAALGGLAALPVGRPALAKALRGIGSAPPADPNDAGGLGCVSYEVRGPIAVIGLDSPGPHHRPDVDAYVALSLACARFERDPSIHAAVLHGHGADFAVGDDGSAAMDFEVRGSMHQRTVGRPMKPLIAAVHGETSGPGHGLLLAADVRIAVDTARFTNADELDADGAAAKSFERDVGRANAMRYLLSGDAMSAHEAFRIGLVQDIAATRAEAFDRAMEFAKRIADRRRAIATA